MTKTTTAMAIAPKSNPYNMGSELNGFVISMNTILSRAAFMAGMIRFIWLILYAELLLEVKFAHRKGPIDKLLKGFMEIHSLYRLR
jgi:hypothetical protein